MKLAVVVQRYGPAINGGAELHARYIAEHLARHADIEVLTTCASDYVTWRNELSAGVDRVNGVAVRRFPVRHERNPLEFGKQSERVFEAPHSVGDELDWLDAEGPSSPALVDYISKHAATFDFLLFFSYRYYHSYHGARAAGARAVLVPTAERDSAVGLSIFIPIFKGVRALMYNSPEERAMIEALSGNQDVPGVVVGIGSDVPQNPQPGRFRQKFNIRGPFAIYVGRIDENKGCPELFDFFQTYARDVSGRLSLVLVGNSLLPIPQHPRIHHLGFLDDADKFDAMAASDLLIMPSYFESLSMVALEAWALAKPVLANGKCDVLKGQCIRSNAGLYYEGPSEFAETLSAIEKSLAQREPGAQRPAVLPRALRLAGHRTEIPRDARELVETACRARRGSVAGVAGSTKAGMSARRLSCGEAANGPGRAARTFPATPGAGGAGAAAGWRRPEPAGSGTPASSFERPAPVSSQRRFIADWKGLVLPARRPAVHQVLATLGYGDAIGHEVLGIQRALRQAGFASDIFVETADRRLEPLTRDYRELVDASHRDNLLLHHFSIGSKASRTAYAIPDRMALIYHNITPPEYFVGVHPTLARQCFRGRRELQAYVERCDLALGDSEFNRQDLDALGFPRTDVLPVVPDFSHLDVDPNRFIADQFDDDWTNVLFVGRVIANKKIEDLILYFHAYQARFNSRSRLIIVGVFSLFERYMAALNHLIEELGVRDVHFVGHVADEELVAYYEVADLFLCASEHEGFCVPLVEAFYKQVPVLAYAATAVPATMDGAGVLFDDHDPMYVAALMDGIVSNPALQDEIVEGQIAAVRRLRSKDFSGTLLGFVNRILSAPRAPEPRVAFDFWQQFDAAEELEELRQVRPSAYKALPEILR